MNHTIGLVAAKGILGASLALGFAHAHATSEDSPSWSCVDDGNRICGPNNPEGKPAACYDDGGVIVALWPCSVVVNPDGSSDVFTPDERQER